jgi:hypothetical protein
MLRRFRAHLRQQFVGYLALFVALSGTAYAAATIGPAQIKNDAVRSRHVKDGAVKNPDLGANSVGTGKVLNGTLLKQDFKAGQIPPAVPPTEPVRLVKDAGGSGNCGNVTGEFCRNGDTWWRNYDLVEGYAPVAFYRDRSGIVHLQGSLRLFVAGEEAGPPFPAFVLPPGYRPRGTRWFAVWNSFSSTKLGAVEIRSNGEVAPRDPFLTNFLSLDGIQFRP